MKKLTIALTLLITLLSSLSIQSVYAGTENIQQLTGKITSKSCCYSEIVDDAGNLWAFELPNHYSENETIVFWINSNLPLEEQYPIAYMEFSLFNEIKGGM